MNTEGFSLIWKITRERHLTEVRSEARINLFEQFPSVVSCQFKVMKKLHLRRKPFGSHEIREECVKRYFGVLHMIATPTGKQASARLPTQPQTLL